MQAGCHLRRRAFGNYDGLINVLYGNGSHISTSRYITPTDRFYIHAATHAWSLVLDANEC